MAAGDGGMEDENEGWKFLIGTGISRGKIVGLEFENYARINSSLFGDCLDRLIIEIKLVSFFCANV